MIDGNLFLKKYTPLTTCLLFLWLAYHQADSRLNLYSDGSHVFLNILEGEETFHPVQARFISNLTKQILPVILIQFGVTDISLLSLVFGLNQFLIPLIGLILSFLVLPKSKKIWIVFVFLSYLLNLHHNNIYINHESFVTVAIFWPVFFYLLFSERNSGQWAVWLAILALSSTYEASIILQLLILAAIVIRVKALLKRPLSFYITLLVSILSIAICCYWILHPQDEMLVKPQG